MTGGQRGDVLIEAKVVATADNEARARRSLASVRIDAVIGRSRADGPSGLGPPRRLARQLPRYGADADVAVAAGRRTAASRSATWKARIEARTVNGGVKFTNLAGEVTGRTSNGGVDVDLNGATWVGAGLDVETSNGGVRFASPNSIPRGSRPDTVNGGIDIDFPLTVQGRDRS